MSEQEKNKFEVDHGTGPKFEVTDLPEAPKNLSSGKWLLIMGPAVIAGAGGFGSGEWLIGPGLFVKYGLALLWITTVSVVLQFFLNKEMCRYTLYTGEPIMVGFMRLQPGKLFWGWFFAIIMFLERGLPGWALGAATAIVAFQIGAIPGAGDKITVVIWAYLAITACAILLTVGKKIERTIEWANWFKFTIFLGGLLILDIYIVPANVWVDGLKGIFSFGYVPQGVDLLLLGALVGYSGYGGAGNNAITNWYRDSGYGMAQKMGYIPAMIGGKEVEVAGSGAVAAPSPENLSRWQEWMKLLRGGQIGFFLIGCLLAMYLPGILYVAVMPAGQSMPSWGIASASSGLVQQLGGFGWFLALFFGFWILFGSALNSMDIVVRQTTDMLWFGSERLRAISRKDIRKVYYMLLAAFVVWGISYLNLSAPAIILALSANVANFTMALSAIMTLRLNRKVLPKEFRGSLLSDIMLICVFLFFGFFFSLYFTYNILKM